MRATGWGFWTAAAAVAVFAASCGSAVEMTVHETVHPTSIVIPLPPLPFLGTTTTTTTAPPHPAPHPSGGSAPPAQTASFGGTNVVIPASTRLVSLSGQTYHYSYPGGPSDGSIPPTWYGYQTVLPVIDSAPGWLEVRLAQRPNQSVTWVRARDVEVSSTPYFLVLGVGAQHLMVYFAGQQIASYPVGVGTYADPTPTGDYFLAFQAPPPNAGYGPFVFVTSAHSNVITDWEEQGDAIVAIHGPITSGADAQIGSTGAHISHGCVRLHDSDLDHLAPVPAGTPLTIIP
jgi:hypothetical protein